MKKVLIVVDMLNDFCTEGGALYFPQSEKVKEFIAKKLQEYQDAREPVIYLCDAHEVDDLEFKKFPPHAIRNTKGAMIIDSLMPRGRANIIIEKRRYSGFYDTTLEFYLQRLDPSLVEVVGVCTSICVMDTVGGLANRDYNVVVYKDGVADFDDAAHEVALKRMEGLYGAKIA